MIGSLRITNILVTLILFTLVMGRPRNVQSLRLPNDWDNDSSGVLNRIIRQAATTTTTAMPSTTTTTTTTTTANPVTTTTVTPTTTTTMPTSTTTTTAATTPTTTTAAPQTTTTTTTTKPGSTTTTPAPESTTTTTTATTTTTTNKPTTTTMPTTVSTTTTTDASTTTTTKFDHFHKNSFIEKIRNRHQNHHLLNKWTTNTTFTPHGFHLLALHRKPMSTEWTTSTTDGPPGVPDTTTSTVKSTKRRIIEKIIDMSLHRIETRNGMGKDAELLYDKDVSGANVGDVSSTPKL